MEVTAECYAPQLSDTKVLITTLKESYGLTALSLSSLNGYDDLNFHAKVEENHDNRYIEQICPHGYLVKVINSFDSKQQDFVLGQQLLMDHLASHGVKCQEEVKNKEGQFFSSIDIEKDGDVVTHTVSVRTYVPGILLDEVTLTSTLAYDVGKFVGQITKALQDFHFPFYDNFTPLWNMDKLYKVKAVTYAVEDESKRQVAVEVIKTFESEVIPRREAFRKGQIHGDINEQNILVQKTSSGVEISGIIDLQDSTQSCIIYDLALAIAYMMMVNKSDVPVNDIGGHVLAGYESVYSLNEAERSSLRVLAAGRMAMSLVYGAFSYMRDPSNEYLLVTSHAGWKNLVEFWQGTEETVWEKWNEIIRSYTE